MSDHIPGSSPASAPRILAVANQKGGVAKTTTVASIGAALVVALVDAGGIDLAILVAAGLSLLGALVTLGLRQSE